MQQNWRRVIHRRGLVSEPNGLGDSTPTDSTSGHPVFPVSLRIWVKLLFSFVWIGGWLSLFAYHASRSTLPHVGPLGLWLFGVSRVLYTCRPAGAKCSKIGGVSSSVGAWSSSSTGWETQPLRIHPPVIPYRPVFDNTLRSAGAKDRGLWAGEGTSPLRLDKIRIQHQSAGRIRSVNSSSTVIAKCPSGPIILFTIIASSSLFSSPVSSATKGPLMNCLYTRLVSLNGMMNIGITACNIAARLCGVRFTPADATSENRRRYNSPAAPQRHQPPVLYTAILWLPDAPAPCLRFRFPTPPAVPRRVRVSRA